MKIIEYYFDFLSPYSYLSWQWIKENKKKLSEKKIEFSFKPVTLSSIIGYYETKGPAQIETKRNYLFKDCLRFLILLSKSDKVLELGFSFEDKSIY